MANEAICYETPTMFARYTVADGTGISKGTILKLTTPNTAITAGSATDPVAGIAWMEKVASDGSTQITSALNGTFGLYAMGSISCGNQVVVETGAGSNFVKVYTTLDDEKGRTLGRALETTTGSAVIKVRLEI